MCVFVAFLLAMTGYFGRMGVAIYYFTYDMQRVDLVSLLMVAPPLAAAAGIVLFAPLAARSGKKQVVVVSFVLSGIFRLALYAVDASNVTAVVVLSLLYGLVQFSAPILMSMVPDCIDHAEDRTGIRCDGTAYATISFSTKLASAIGGSVGVLLLSAVGYVANADQTAGAMRGIDLVVNVAPGVCYLLGVLPMLLYPLSNADCEGVKRRLAARRAGGGEEAGAGTA